MNFAYRISARREEALAELTSLDVRVMRLLWAQGARNVRQLHALLASREGADFQTVMASVSRLAAAGLVAPEHPRSGISYSYAPTLSREEFIRLCGGLRERAVGG